MRLFASGLLARSSNKLRLLIWTCLSAVTQTQPNNESSLKPCMSASERSYLGLLNGATFRAEPGQSQIGIIDWALTRRLHCLTVTYGMTSSSTYYYTKAMTDLFVNTAGESGVKFQSISTTVDFWAVSFPFAFMPSTIYIVRNH